MTLRADAQRNLDRLLGAAGECFAERGLRVSVDEIARRAGVGHGTVFRRFPTKEALLEAVLERELDGMLAAAERALAEPDPGAAFESFYLAAAEAYGRNLALLEGFDRCERMSQFAALQKAAEVLVRRAQEAGALRRDLARDEIFDLVPAASRYPDVILDGLKPPRGETSGSAATSS